MTEQGGVHRGGGEALILAEFGADVARQADQRVGQDGAQDFGGAAFMRRVAVGVQEADGERAEPSPVGKAARAVRSAVSVQFGNDGAGFVQAFGHLDAVFRGRSAGGVCRCRGCRDAAAAGAPVPAHRRTPEAGEHGGAAGLRPPAPRWWPAWCQGRRSRRVGLGMAASVRIAFEAAQDGLRRVPWVGWHFAEMIAAGRTIQQHDVGEGAAGVSADPAIAAQASRCAHAGTLSPVRKNRVMSRAVSSRWLCMIEAARAASPAATAACKARWLSTTGCRLRR